MTPALRTALAALLALLVAGVVAACGSEPKPTRDVGDRGERPPGASLIRRDPRNARVTLTIGSKNFTEQEVLGQIYAQALAAAGYRVHTRLDLGNQDVAFRALLEGAIDAYPEYTGTALVTFCAVPRDRIPHDGAAAYEQMRRCVARLGVAALPPTPFSNANALAMTRATQRRLGGIVRISELRGRAHELTLSGTPECRRRADCLLGLRDVYGLRFERFVAVPPRRRHAVLENGVADLSIVYTTDPQNARDRLVLLRDDLGIFPPYNSSLLVDAGALRQAGPDLARVVAHVQRGLTSPAMQELNARVDLDGKAPAVVAREYLEESGYVRGRR